MTVVVNDPVRLECEASGLPVPTLTWLKEGSPISSFSNGIQVILLVPISVFPALAHLTNVKLDNYLGNYQCHCQ